jgi:3-oxoacyl-[acyl-carrier-protein] synthase III
MPPHSPTATLTPASANAATSPSTAAAILGVGAHEPEGVLSNADLEAMVDTSNTWILERTGIRERRRAGSGETCSVMATSAARRALARAGSPEIDLIMVATVSADTLFPAASCLVQRRLGMPGIPAMDINGACSGFMYGLTLADSLVRAGRVSNVLLIASEAMTTLVDYTDRSTCVLFGDGAGAVVVGGAAGGGVVASRWGADGRDADLIYYGPDEAHDRKDAHIRMAGKGTFKQAVERLAALARGLCDDAGWRIEDVDHVIPHQANLRIVEAAAKRTGVPMDRVIVNGDRLGNTSAASIPLAMAEADATGRLQPGDKVLCVAFGAGSTWGGVALEWTLAPSRL